MPGTINIHNSTDGEVMAPLGAQETFYRGKHQRVLVTKVGPDEETSLEIREALVGLTIPIIFTQERLIKQGIDLGIPEGSVLSYGNEVISSLREAGKGKEADQLAEQITNDLCSTCLSQESLKSSRIETKLRRALH